MMDFSRAFRRQLGIMMIRGDIRFEGFDPLRRQLRNEIKDTQAKADRVADRETHAEIRTIVVDLERQLDQTYSTEAKWHTKSRHWQPGMQGRLPDERLT